MKASKLSRPVVVGIIVVAAIALVIIAALAINRARAVDGQVVVRMTGLESGKEVTSPAVAYLYRSGDVQRERVTDSFEIAPEGDTFVTASGEALQLVLAQPPVYADGSVYKESVTKGGAAGTVIKPVQGFLCFGPAQTTFEVNMSDFDTTVVSASQMTSWIDYSLQQSWSNLELSRQQLADTNTNMPTENEANNASQESKASEHENEIEDYEAQVVQYVVLLKRADALDDADIEGAVAIYKEWCLIKEQ